VPYPEDLLSSANKVAHPQACAGARVVSILLQPVARTPRQSAQSVNGDGADATATEFLSGCERRYVGLDVVEDVWRRSDLSHDQALALADTEKHAPRASKRGLAGTRGAR